jgi:hypothetical protein
MSAAAGESRATRIVVYWLPAAGMTVALWTVPNLIALGAGRLTGPPGISDFWLHAAAYMLITFAWWRVLYTWPAPAVRRWAVPLAAVAGLLVGVIDEALQAIPALPRNCDWLDYLGDVVGSLLAAGIAWELARIARRRAPEPGR